MAQEGDGSAAPAARAPGAIRELFPARGRAQTAVETVVETVKGLLVDRKLRPGDLLPSEKEMAASLAVSRGSIREAMRILSAFGVVEVKQGDGTYVGTSANRKLFDPLLFRLLVTQPEMEELAELRVMVEEGIVRLAVAHADGSDLAELRRAYDAMAESVRREPRVPRVVFEADLRFHTVLGAITHNRLVANLYQFVIELLIPTMHPGYGLETHWKILDSLDRRDLEAALRAVDEHDEVWHRLNRSEREGDGAPAAREESHP